tara:strand:- start:2343 stop:2918 length:576 start_codon:yes stop_codon:yes gene_type:complete
MTTAVMYNDAGLITAVRTGSTNGVKVDAEASGQSYLLTDESVDLNSFYVNVSTKTVVRYPEQPSDAYVFDFVSEAWALDITLAKSVAWARVKQSRSQEEFGRFQWGDYVFQCDEVSQRRIQGAVQLAAIQSSMTLEWTLEDNSTQLFTATDYIQIGQSLAVHVSQCHERGRMLRQQINESTTEAELEAIVW